MIRIYSLRKHKPKHRASGPHHPSCPARDGSGPCVGCGPESPSVPAPRPSAAWLDEASEAERRYHSSTALGR